MSILDKLISTIAETEFEFYIALIAIIVIYFWCLGSSWFLLRRNENSIIKKLIDKKDSESFINELNQIPKFEKTFFWEKMKNYFTAPEGKEEGTSTHSPHDFFHPTHLVTKKNGINMSRFLSVAPGLFVGAGILGTFMGLAIGLQDLGSVSGVETSVLTARVDLLVSGISSAFATSIIGMILSIIASGLNSRFKNRLHQVYEGFDSWMLLHIYEDPQSQILNVLSEQTKVRLEKQDGTGLQEYTMGEGLAALIAAQKESTSTMNQMGETIAERIEDKLGDLLQGGAGSAAKESAEKARNTFDQLSEKLMSVAANLDPLLDKLTNGLEANINALGGLVEQVTINLDTYKNQQSTLIDTLDSISQVDSTFNKTLEDFKTVAGNISSIGLQLTETTNFNKEQVRHLTLKWEDLQTHASSTFNQLNDLSSMYDSVSTNLSSIFKEINSEIITYQEALSDGTRDHLKTYHDAILNFSATLGGAADAMEDGVDEIKTAVSVVLDMLKKQTEIKAIAESESNSVADADPDEGALVVNGDFE